MDKQLFNIGTLDSDLKWVRDMENTDQNPKYHAEGNVLIHTKMVCDALLKLQQYKDLDVNERFILLTAAIFHDVGKPATTIRKDGELTSPYHANVGSILTRGILYRNGLYDLLTREHVCGIVKGHMKPFFAVKGNLKNAVAKLSLYARNDLLAIHSMADGRGKIPVALDGDINVEIFAEQAKEMNCLKKPYDFYSDHSRFLHFQKQKDLDNQIFDDTKSNVIMMSGLPGSGKDFYIAQNFANIPVISLDDIRAERGIKPTDNQSAVLRIANERATEYLRKGEDFIWNATNLTRIRRDVCKRLFVKYNARIHMIHVEVPYDILLKQNKNRIDSVPEHVIESYIDKWEIPTLEEAHQVTYVESNSLVDFPRNFPKIWR